MALRQQVDSISSPRKGSSTQQKEGPRDVVRHPTNESCGPVVALVAFTLTAVTCAGTRGRRSAPDESGFLRDYSQLTEREGAAAKLSYLNPQADWSSYDTIWIESVSMWANSETSKVKPEDRQMLIDFFYKALHEELAKDQDGVRRILLEGAEKARHHAVKTLQIVRKRVGSMYFKDK